MGNHTHVHEIENSGYLKLATAIKIVFGIFVLIGIATFAFAVSIEPTRVWANFLVNYFYFLSLALFGGFFVALQHITNAYWSVTVRRLAESLFSFLPVALLLAVGLFLGKGYLYEWADADVVAKDHLLQLKAAYLNTSFFTIRHLIFLLVWIGFTLKMRSNSVAQDATGEHKFTLSNIKLSAVFLPFFAISYTFTSFDLLMSLEPHWFSTIFGVYCFSGLFFSGLSLLAVITIFARKQGVLSDDIVNENHLHDIGKLMFAFTVFWAYIMFSQLMLIWYANLPEETPYYILRLSNGWWPIASLLFFVHFVIPFFLLLPREAKRSENYLFKMALFMLVAQWLDVYFMVMPVFFPKAAVFGWIEIGMFLGFLGIFILSISRFLEKVPAIPVKDPRLAQCIAHTQ